MSLNPQVRKTRKKKLCFLALTWWLAFWESVTMDKIPASKEAENRPVV
jgi:hypothetical protein